MSEVSAGFHSWGIVEVMGHKTYAGEISEQIVAGTAFVRIDVPEISGIAAYTKLIGPGSVYAISPTSEQVARIAAMKLAERPVSPYVVPVEYQIAAKVSNVYAFAEGDDDEFEPEEGDAAGVDGDLALDPQKVDAARAWADQIRDELFDDDDEESEILF